MKKEEEIEELTNGRTNIFVSSNIFKKKYFFFHFLFYFNFFHIGNLTDAYGKFGVHIPESFEETISFIGTQCSTYY